MEMSTPEVYIAGLKMSDHGTANRPLLDALTITWGSDSVYEYDAPMTMTAQLLIRTETVSLGFLKRGASTAVIDPAGPTLFAGRITALTTSPHPSIPGAWVYTINAAGFQADLENYSIGPIRWAYTTDAHVALDRLNNKLPGNWTMDGALRTPEWGTSVMIYQRENWLVLLDRLLRGQRARRHETTTYAPGAGLTRRLTITNERSPNGPAADSVILRLDSSNIAEDIVWEQTPDDLVTDIKLSAYAWLSNWKTDNNGRIYSDISNGSTSYEMPVEDYVDTRTLQNAAGIHQITIDTHLRVIDPYVRNGITLPDEPEPDPDLPILPLIPGQVRSICSYFLNSDTPWRPTEVTVADSRLLSKAAVLDLLDVTKRYRGYLIIQELPANNPTRYQKVAAHIIAGSAVWEGKKKRWNLTLTLGRQTVVADPIGTL